MLFKCSLCGSQFSRRYNLTEHVFNIAAYDLSSDELRCHSQSCTEVLWQGATNLNLPIIPTFSSSPSCDVTAPLQTETAALSLGQDLFLTNQTSSVGQDTDQAFEDFLSCLSSSTGDVVEGLQTPYDQFGVFSGTRDSTIKVCEVLHELAVKAIQPYPALNRRRKVKDKPIYTRRQVDDMLNAVSGCFAGAMVGIVPLSRGVYHQFPQGEVLKRVDGDVTKGDKTSDPVKEDVVSKESSDHGLRQFVSDALPRFINDLQIMIDERRKAD
ncbi:hypothetical protein C0992_006636 [Termitomyces sp. T32_za158]|nr:hypothetical protein C0992_006636 [Termitomyces sp. T32_za158]